MFQPRDLFHRKETGPSGRVSQAEPDSRGEVPADRAERHPAMRGLAVPPVHGYHCICERCNQHRAA